MTMTITATMIMTSTITMTVTTTMIMTIIMTMPSSPSSSLQLTPPGHSKPSSPLLQSQPPTTINTIYTINITIITLMRSAVVDRMEFQSLFFTTSGCECCS